VPEGAQVVVQHYVVASNERARALLAGAGYAPVRGVYVMRIELDGAPPPPEWPAAVSARTMVMGQDERVAHEAHEDAFRDLWGRPRSTFERFLTWTRQEGFDPTLCFLAEADGGVVGVLFSKAVAGKGWVEVVGVRRPWRKRGLALALLHHAFAEHERRGVREIGLSVDAESLTGAPRVYTRAGMHVAQNFVIYRKELRAGEDLTVQTAD
jgi:GNAT superfamily N-acetyltransferase